MTNLYCIACPNGCLLTLVGEGIAMLVEGNKCEKGIDFAKAEMNHPTRMLTTTVRTTFPEVPVISVRTAGEIPKEKIPKAMEEINKIVIELKLPIGETIIENVAGTEVSVIITSPALMQIGAELENKNAEISKAGGSGTPQSGSEDGGESAYAAGGGRGGERAYAGNGEVLDTLGPEGADGFVGAAGEAVGIDGEHEDDEDSRSIKGDVRKQQRGRARIKG